MNETHVTNMHSPVYTRPQSGYNPPMDVDCPIRINLDRLRVYTVSGSELIRIQRIV